jgi:NADPH-dependent 2,4-dienoyl-CoA reductase/sulfur reductase-like enzyme
VLVIGAGFTGSEVASACIDRGIAVTAVEINETPLLPQLGAWLGGHAQALQLRAGVDLRCRAAVTALVGKAGRLVGARLADGGEIEADVAVVCLGAVRNTEWLDGAGLAAGPLGMACDTHCRAIRLDGAADPDVFVCGDVARFPHPLAGGENLIAIEHWGAAVDQARVAAANLVTPGSASLAAEPPRFWSMQFGSNFKSVGLPSIADEVMLVQGSLESGRFVAAYGRGGAMVGAVAVNQAQWLPFYERQVVEGGAFPPAYRVVDQPGDAMRQPARFSNLEPQPPRAALELS